MQHSECEVWWMNPKLSKDEPHHMLDGITSQFNFQDQIVPQGNYFYPSMRVVSTDEKKNGQVMQFYYCYYFFLKRLWVLLLKKYLVPFVRDEPILNNWYSHNILPMIKMSSRNITQLGTQTTGLCVTIGRYFPDSQREGSGGHPTNLAVVFSGIRTTPTQNMNKERQQISTLPLF